jgi:Fe-S-cluster containining protein
MRLSITSPLYDQPGKTQNITFNYTLEDESMKKILDEIKKGAENVEGESIDLVANAVKKTEGVLQNFIDNFSNEQKKERFDERLRQIREIVVDLDAITSRESDGCPPLDEVWRKLRIIEALARGESISAENSNGTIDSKQDLPLVIHKDMEINSLIIYPDIMTVNFKHDGTVVPYPVHLSFNEQVRDEIRSFVKTLVTLEGDEHQLMLTEPEPICYLCGDCCSQFGVEILPSDIRRFADNMNLSVKEVREKYLDEHRYSWNRGDGCMKKRKFEGEEEPKCVLLEKRENGFYYCSVHAFKPDVCRQFTPHHILCRKVNNIPNWQRLPKNIIRIELGGTKLVFHTFQTHNSMSPGVVINWKEESRLADANQDEKSSDNCRRRSLATH